jgi:predicted small lipoprotein YifL
VIRKVLVATALAALLALTACGDDGETAAPGEESPAAVETPAAADEEAAITRYCDAVAEAERRGEELFSGVDEGDEEALMEAERAMLEHVQTSFPRGDELPVEIREDFEAFVAGYEQRVEEGREPTKEQQAAEERLLEWEGERCQSQ